MSDLLITTDAGVTTITLNRPATLNAFNDDMISATVDALKQAERDAAVRVAVLTGTGRAFSSGQDLSDMQNRSADFDIGAHLRHGYHRLIKQIVRMEKPVIGAINGIAAGAGCGVALACDVKVAHENAAFMLAFSKIGLIPDSSLNWLLPRLIGYTRAYQLAITAEKLPAQTALAWGMINAVAPADQFEPTVAEWARKLAQGATKAYALTKRAMWRSFEQDFDAGLDYEAHLQTVAAHTEDNREGVRAFLEKRPAKFVGK